VQPTFRRHSLLDSQGQAVDAWLPAASLACAPHLPVGSGLRRRPPERNRHELGTPRPAAGSDGARPAVLHPARRHTGSAPHAA